MNSQAQKHSFLTQSYKGAYIHSHCEGNKDIVTAQIDTSIVTFTKPCKSIRAAKIAITKAMKGGV